MRDKEFKDWLIARGLADNSVATRLSAVRRIELILPELGVSQPDLDAAYDADALGAVRASLAKLRADAKQGGEAYRILLPESEAPVGRLDNFIAWLGNYREFRESVGGASNQADRIRAHVVQHYVVPARSKGAAHLVVVAGDVHRAMKLQDAMPAVCSALDSHKFANLADVKLEAREGPANSSTVRFTFLLNPVGANWAEYELRRRYGSPIVETDKMVAFALPDDRQVALQRDAKSVQIWLEDDLTSSAAPAQQVRHYLPDQARHSNLPTRLKHRPSGGIAPRRVSLVSIPDHALLRRVLDWYEGLSMSLDRDALEALRRAFVARFRDFVDFTSRSEFHEVEDDYKRALIARAQALLDSDTTLSDEDLGRALLDIISDRTTNLLGYYKTYNHLAAMRAGNPDVIERAAGALARSSELAPIASEQFLAVVWPLISAGQDASMPYGDSRILPTLILSLVRKATAIAVRYQPFHNASVMLLGRSPFANAPLSAAEYSNILAMSEAIFTAMRDEWGWKPRDLWDVQGFIWVTCQKRITTTSNDDPSASASKGIAVQPTNLILYGPPGTGKTYATAHEAVRLCDAIAPDNSTDDSRALVMKRYRELVAEERIAFVTFHQSYSYEEFVEGLRPSATAETGEQMETGFRLADEPGVFKRIAERAETLGAVARPDGFSLGGRAVFKMSLGEAANPEDDYLYDEAMAGGYILLGGDGGMDWSSPKFASKGDMIEARAKAHPDEPRLSPLAGLIEFPFTLRSRVKRGDVIIVTKGNLLFRAIGEVIGDFVQVDRAGRDDYTMHRAMRWLWRDDEGKPWDLVNGKRFSQRTIYELSPRELKTEAVETLIAGATEQPFQPSAKPYVLIIDEINRANISKVFGELITLIEADKRIGMTNELRVELPYSRKPFGVPANLHIVGTMNTADRSIALLDTALRRRFEFRELMPDPSLLTQQVEGVDLGSMLATINQRIEYLFDREHQIGHAYFYNCYSRTEVDEVMRSRVIPLLAEYFYEDWAKVAAVLGDSGNGEGSREGAFLDRQLLKAPAGFDGEEATPRFRWTVRTREQGFSYAAFA